MAKTGNKTQRNSELVYVIAGKEQTQVNARCTELIDKLISPQERDMGLLVVEADKAVIGDVLDELRTLPFLTKKRVVVLRNADKFISSRGQQDEEEEEDEQDGRGTPATASNREILEKYFDNPCPTGVLVMTVSSWQKSTRLAKKLPDIGTLIEIKAPKGKEIPPRLIAYAQEVYNKRLERGAAQLLVDLAGDDITRLYTEVDKLATYAANEKSITTSHVENLVGYNRMYNAFAVIDAMLQRKPAEAIERLRKMFAEDKSADYTTVGALAYQFRNLFTAKKLIEEGHSPYEAAGMARIWYNKEAQLSLLKRLTLKQLGDQIQQLAETDYAIKRGLAQPRVAIEQLVLRMATM
ncbi:MAG: DNA polymerase III subunit delta [Planctomycetota bacterium]